MRWLLAALLGLLCTAAYGQMYKCVDDRGKLSYQEHPCAGTKSLPPPKDATSVVAPQRPGDGGHVETKVPRRSRTTTPAPSSAADATELRCANEWPSVKSRIASILQTATKMRDQGSRDGVKQLAARDAEDFVRDCARYGFYAPDTDDKMSNNDVRAREIIADQTPPRGRAR